MPPKFWTFWGCQNSRGAMPPLPPDKNIPAGGPEPPLLGHDVGFLTLGPKLDPPPFLLVDLRWTPVADPGCVCGGVLVNVQEWGCFLRADNVQGGGGACEKSCICAWTPPFKNPGSAPDVYAETYPPYWPPMLESWGKSRQPCTTLPVYISSRQPQRAVGRPFCWQICRVLAFVEGMRTYLKLSHEDIDLYSKGPIK